MLYNLISILSLSYIALWVLYLLVNSVVLGIKDRAELLRFFKSFTHGKFVGIYPAAIPLFWMAHRYNGEEVIDSIFLALKNTFSVVVLDVDYGLVKGILADLPIFAIAFVALLAAIFLNTAFFFLTVLFEKTVNACRTFFCVHFARKLFVVVGDVEKSRPILESKKRFDRVLFLGKPNAEQKDWLFARGVAYRRIEDAEELYRFVARRFLKLRHWRVILNNATDEENLLMTDKLSDLILKHPTPTFVLENKYGLDVYVFGAYENSDSFYHYVQLTKGRVHYKNRYTMVAYDFEGRYPLTAFMDEKHLDFANATLKDNVDVNVVMVGFGKVNRQLFLASVANNQFVSLDQKKEPYVHRVSYYIYDKEDAEQDKGLNHSFFRYQREILEGGVNKEDYLDLIAAPAEPEFRTLNIHSKRFYESLKRDLSIKQDPSTNKDRVVFNYVVVSYGEDLENYDLATKLYAKLGEWGLSDTTKLFVRIRNHRLNAGVNDGTIGRAGGMLCFGDEQSAIYDIHGIVNETNECMARHRHYTYVAENNPEADEAELVRLAGEEWYNTYNETQRSSNVYACLNLRFKLNLLGYDYIPAKKAKELGLIPKECERTPKGYEPDVNLPQKAYYDAYQKGAPINDGDEVKFVQGKQIVPYQNAKMKPGSPRYNLAVQEHARWNAYMITCGYIPSTKAELVINKGRIHEQRKHSNITTTKGLEIFRKEMLPYKMAEYQKELEEYKKDPQGEAPKCPTEEDTDVIRYDYHPMDDAAWLLAAGEMVIVERKALQAAKEPEKKCWLARIFRK